jgi:hypothetical protein
MPSLRIKWNYRQDTAIPSSTPVRVLRRDGSWAIKVWLGFVDVAIAKQIPKARPVKLEVYGYALNDHGLEVVYLKEGQFIQGALTRLGVYAVTVEGVPRVVQ